MKKSIILISVLAIFTFYACQNNHSSENDEKNDNRQDTEVVDNKNDEEIVEKNSEEELSKERSNEEQIQFIKDEFAKIEADNNLKQINYVFQPKAKGSPPTTYSLEIYKNNANEIVKTHYLFEVQGADGADDITYYYNNEELFFIYGIAYSGSASSTSKEEDRYYFKNNKVIKHLEKTTTKNFETEKSDIFNQENSSVDEETQKKLTDWAYHFIEIQSDEDFAQWVESLYK